MIPPPQPGADRIEHDITADSAHAFLVDLLATVGLVGVVSWVVVLGAAGVVLRRQFLAVQERGDRVRIAVVAGLLAAHGVQAATSVPTVASVWVGGLLLGLVLVLVPLSASRFRARNQLLRRSGAQQGGRGSRQQRGGRGGGRQVRGGRGGRQLHTAPASGLPTVLATVALVVVAVAVPSLRVLTNNGALAEAQAPLRADRPDLARHADDAVPSAPSDRTEVGVPADGHATVERIHGNGRTPPGPFRATSCTAWSRYR